MDVPVPQDAETVQKTVGTAEQEVQKAPQQKQVQDEKQGMDLIRPVEQTFTSADYAQQYDPEAVYKMKGDNVSLDKLDIDREQIISALDKDQVLRQYQYFVRTNFTNQSQPVGAVRGMENFEI